MTAPHTPAKLIASYAAGADLPVDVVWALEVHLERCASCRAELATAVAVDGGAVASITDRAWNTLRPLLPATSPARRRTWAAPLRWLALFSRPALVRWAAPAALPWLAMTIFVPAVAMLLDLATRNLHHHGPPMLLLIAPVVPVLGVAASWSRWFDPVGELICSTARSGLALVLRRTLAVLVAAVPVLGVAGAATGASPARWLLPCLACTAGTLAIGARVGVARAAVAVTVAWVGLVVAPGLARSQLPAALDPAHAPVWAAGLLVAAAVLLLWRDAYQRVASRL